MYDLKFFSDIQVIDGNLPGISNVLQIEGPFGLLNQKGCLEWFEFSELHKWVF